MGFDLSITLSMQMCPQTGKPFYYGTHKETGKLEKIYSFPSLDVPEELRAYMVQRGHYLHAYTDLFNENNVFDVSVDTFLEAFPSWKEVEQNEYYCSADYDWHHEDHKEFKALLRWCQKQELSFRVSWSY